MLDRIHATSNVSSNEIRVFGIWVFFFICFENKSSLSAKSEKKKAFIISERAVGKVATGKRNYSTVIS